MNRSSFCFLASLLALMPSAVSGTGVTVRNGNVFFTDAAGHSRELTSSGRDSNALLAPDGRWVVFVRKVAGKKIATGADETEPTELWQIRTDGKEATRLVRSHGSEKPESIVAGFERVQFSSDGKLIYFLTPAWATSGAIHVIDSTNGREYFVCPGNDLKVVPAGEYRDCLLVQQHRYFIGGGSYDWYWLLRPDGREVGPVGENLESFESTYRKE
jgi:dipeptidyl aminopeptidase/acylaminoacyl peptidase